MLHLRATGINLLEIWYFEYSLLSVTFVVHFPPAPGRILQPNSQSQVSSEDSSALITAVNTPWLDQQPDIWQVYWNLHNNALLHLLCLP